ncbi:MAG TPA: methionine--tRNA ligase [Phycisphaerae bacterium]|nr:methionine--tRNA ligase [Phycisphaerae bacterium]
MLCTGMSQTYYVTTPIYYVNDVPHIGHSYTTIAADVLARFFRAAGRDVHFLTGTDEHGIKIVKAAAARGVSPRQLADEVVVHFQDLWRELNISNDDFIRTSEVRHEKRVQEIIRRLVAADQIYLGSYEGWYDEGQEEFVTESTARDNDYKSPINGQPLARYSEPSYFFRLGAWVPKLIEHIEANPGFILPEARRNEVLSKLRQGVDDLSISRPLAKLNNWGVPMPNDPAHSVYVWIDALSNYLTALGWPAIDDEHDGKGERYWPADVHLIGKDILWFHTVYWPCLLMALEAPLPKCVFAHGWWTSEGKKMSKSLGNFVSRERIAEICREYSVDVFRYFLLRAVAFGQDGDFSAAVLRTRYNTDLANGVGNLLSRTVNMIGRYCDGAVPACQPAGEAEREVLDTAEKLSRSAPGAMESCQFHALLDGIQHLTQATNRYIDVTQPFKLAKDAAQAERLGTILYTCAEAVRMILVYLGSVMPQASANGLAQLGWDAGGTPLDKIGAWGALRPGGQVRKGEALFPRKP